MSNFVMPAVKAFLICDRVIHDRLDNKHSAIGLFDNIVAPDFPVTHNGFGLLLLLINASGRYNFRIDLVYFENEEEVIARIEFSEIEIKDTAQSTNIGMNFSPIEFKQAGRYEFKLFANGHFVDRRDLEVLLSKGE